MVKVVSSGLLVACALGAASSAAALTAAQIDSIDAILQQALQEQKVILTCGATLTQEEYGLLTGWWGDHVEKSITILTENDYPAERIDRFRTTARPETVMLAGDTPWSEVMAFCRENDGWYDNVRRFGFVILHEEISKIIEGN